MAYFNKKAQSLTELSTFGSALLLVLSFFISYGMRYNYQQDMQMRAFRRALPEAYNNATRPDASASIVLVEDRHIPDPRDMFGAGNIVPVQAGAEVIWGNTMQEQYTDLTDSRLPRIKYVLNDPKKGGKEIEYTTAGYWFISTADQFYVMFPDNNVPQPISWANVRCYQPAPDSPKQAKILLPDNQTEVISEVYLKLNKQFLRYQVIGVGPANAADGDLLTRLDLLSPGLGQLNPNYTQLGGNTGKLDASGNPIYVTPDTLQGVLLDEEQYIRRKGTLTIQETPAKTISTSEYSFSNNVGDTVITHKIRSSSGTETIPYFFKRHKKSIWETAK